MDLISVHPVFSLYNRSWPIFTHVPSLPPAKFVHETPGRTGHALDSIVSPGTIVSGGTVRRSVLSPDVRVHSGAEVDGSVVMNGATIGAGAVVRNAILDKNVAVPPGGRVGIDPAEDRARGFTVSPGGVTVVGKNLRVPE